MTSSGTETESQGTDSRAAVLLAVGPDDHVLGRRDAPVTVVEYGDFECPYCALAAPVLRELVDLSDGQVRLVFRNFPIFQVHPYALTAALAAEAVPADLYWEFHELLFRNQERLTDADLKSYARGLGLDPFSVIGDRAQPYGDKVETDYATGIELGVEGTPSLFVEGTAYRDRVALAELRRATGLRAH